MDNTRQLPYLLKLIGDDSPVVRKEVIQALARYGPALAAELASLPGPPEEADIERITSLLAVEGGVGESESRVYIQEEI